jgi:hypothetical protein
MLAVGCTERKYTQSREKRQDSALDIGLSCLEKSRLAGANQVLVVCLFWHLAIRTEWWNGYACVDADSSAPRLVADKIEIDVCVNGHYC